MEENKRVIHTGPGYQYDENKTAEENWELAKVYYKKIGTDIGDFPKEEIDKLMKEELKKKL